MDAYVYLMMLPIRLKPDDWTSGDLHWLLDVIAPDPKATTRVIANLRQVVKDGDLRVHPAIRRLVDKEALKSFEGLADVGAADLGGTTGGTL